MQQVSSSCIYYGTGTDRREGWPLHLYLIWMPRYKWALSKHKITYNWTLLNRIYLHTFITQNNWWKYFIICFYFCSGDPHRVDRQYITCKITVGITICTEYSWAISHDNVKLRYIISEMSSSSIIKFSVISREDLNTFIRSESLKSYIVLHYVNWHCLLLLPLLNW
jgi:hypothetical protein